MANKPVIPAAGFAFATHTATNPTVPQPGGSLDSELEQLRQSDREVVAWVNTAVRDDGKLANASVTPDSLDANAMLLLTTGWKARGAWVTATVYAVSDYVTEAGSGYVCLIAHTAGANFATDLAASKWAPVFQPGVAKHAIKAAGTARPERAALNFSSALTAVDDAGNDETDIGLNFGTTAGRPAEGNHTHTGVYAASGHTHADLYAALSHQHSRTVATLSAPGAVTNALHNNRFVRVSGSGDVTLDAAADLGAGFFCWIRAAGSGVVLKPQAGETINGLGTYPMLAGESAFVVSDGVALYAATTGATSNTLLAGWELVGSPVDLTNGGADDLTEVDISLAAGYVYQLRLKDAGFSVGAAPYVRFQLAGGAVRTTGYGYRLAAVGDTPATANAAGAAIQLTASITGGNLFNAQIEVTAARDAAIRTMLRADVQIAIAAGGNTQYLATGGVNVAEDNDLVRVYPSSGTFTNGTLSVYRMREAP